MTKLTQDKIITTEKSEYVPPPGGIGKLFFTRMSNHGDAPAQIDGLTGEVDLYSSLLQRSTRTAMKMRSEGIKPDDVIAICSHNQLNSCVPFYATLFLGAIPASLDPILSEDDIVLLLKLVEPKMIFASKESENRIESALKKCGLQSPLVVFGKSERNLELSGFLEGSLEDERTFKPFEVDDLKKTAIIFFSSGTTGLVKPICVHHYGFLSQVNGLTEIGYPNDVLLFYFSMFWIAWAAYTSYCVLSKGCTVVVPKFQADRVWDLVIKYKVTMLPLATTLTVALYNQPFPKQDLKFLKYLLTGGSPVQDSLVLGFRKLLPTTQVFVIYGQSEASGAITSFNPKNAQDAALMLKKPSSTGRPKPGVYYKIVDPDTEEILGPNQTGELRIKTEYQMNGYYKSNPLGVWDSDRFLKTGDIAYYDDDFCFYVIDRLKEVLRYRGFHVAPTILEDLLLTHEAVQEAVVVGLPHQLDREHPMGLVVLKDGFKGKIEADELRKHVDEKVDEMKKLRGGVKIVEKIPVTSSGKKKRLEIRNMVLRGEV